MIASRSIFRLAALVVALVVVLLGIRVFHHAHKAHRLAEIITRSHNLVLCLRSYHRDTGSYPNDLQSAVPQDSIPHDYRKWFGEDVQITYTIPSGETAVESRMLVVDYEDYEIIYNGAFERTVREK